MNANAQLRGRLMTPSRWTRSVLAGVALDTVGCSASPADPVMECGRPFPAAITALQHLRWVTVSVRRTVQIATRAELAAGCDPQWKDVIKLESQRGSALNLSAGGPAFTPRPARLRICIY